MSKTSSQSFYNLGTQTLNPHEILVIFYSGWSHQCASHFWLGQRKVDRCQLFVSYEWPARGGVRLRIAIPTSKNVPVLATYIYCPRSVA